MKVGDKVRILKAHTKEYADLEQLKSWFSNNDGSVDPEYEQYVLALTGLDLNKVTGIITKLSRIETAQVLWNVKRGKIEHWVDINDLTLMEPKNTPDFNVQSQPKCLIPG